MAKILLIIANKGYQVKEYEDTKKAIIDNGHEVITGGMTKKKGGAISNIMTTTKIDISIDEIDINNYDGLYLIGGPLALNYLDNKKVHSLIKSFHDNTNKPYGAICISPRILVNAGVMNGVKMTGWNDDGDLQGICEEAESIYIEESVVKDGRVITADGPMSAYEFGKTIGSQIFYS